MCARTRSSSRPASRVLARKRKAMAWDKKLMLKKYKGFLADAQAARPRVKSA